ncbi:MFS transporter [Acuticoccus mangrovi]|uniref:MFS transporter n=1 Tax=Acuticoccus mangrovi TaxID=2796142 RepID=A0A934ME41_9HYPH|nr:MFS transporter [Acuticoccus mangrovi]MBJ3777072.1 MFS transporter [Acuticoccus mangrovi]
MIRFPKFEGARKALGPGPYRIYTIGNATSLIGTWMQRISVGYLAWELTHSATWLGIVAFADLFPTVIVGPVAGVAADRWNRRRVLLLMQALGLLQAIGLAALYLAGGLTIGSLFTITLVLGVITAFAQPARLAMISLMVPREVLGSAVAINAITFNLARFIGPGIAGVLISTAGVAWVFALNAVSYAVFVWALVRLPALAAAPARRGSSFLADLGEGITYVMRDRAAGTVLLAMIVTGVASRPLIELLPGFSDRVFGRGADGLAMLTSSVGIGAALGGLWVANRRPGSPMTRTMVTAALCGAITVTLFATTSSFPVALLLIMGAGCCWTLTGISAQTLLQLGVPDEVRGRVLALFGLILKASPAVGALVTGALADVFGLRPTVAAAAILAAIFILWLALHCDEIAARFEAPQQAGGSR